MWRQFQAYLFPGAAERDAGFRLELTRQSRTGLLVIGGVLIGASAFMLLARLLFLTENSTMPFRLRQGGLVIALGILTIATSRIRRLDPWARLMGVVVGVATAALLIWASLLILSQNTNPDDFIPGQITLVMLVAVTALPLRPMQTFAMGASIGIVYLASTLVAARFLHESTGPDPNYILFILMLSLLCTGLTAVVYHQKVANYQLRESQARRMLADNATSMARLAAAISHELNNPMGALLSGVDTLLLLASRQATCTGPEQSRFVVLQSDVRKSIQQSAQRLKDVVARMQRFTNLDQAEIQAANINELVSDVVALVKPQLGTGHKIQLELQPLPPVRCRPQQISAVLSGLVDNAVQAIDGAGEVLITTRPAEAKIEVEIRDNGRGVDPKELANIFDPGFKVSEQRIGTGNWSMFTARQVVREHGGDIFIDSNIGRGTTVTVTLPSTSVVT